MQLISRLNNNLNNLQFDLAVSATTNSFILKLFDTQTHSLHAISPNLNSVLQRAQNYTIINWKPNTRSSDSLLLSVGLLAAFKTLIE